MIITFNFLSSQAGLLSAYIIKKLCFGRFVKIMTDDNCLLAFTHRVQSPVIVSSIILTLEVHLLKQGSTIQLGTNSFQYIFFSRYPSPNYLLCYRHSTDREVAIMILMAYLSYMLAEVSVSNNLEFYWF